jgi:hypothetical protein
MMLRKIISAFLILIQAMGPAAAYSSTDGQFYFRYKIGNTQIVTSDDDNASKDITAFYIAGVGEQFSEKLPMKAEWKNDDWRIVGGSLPNGISFNSATLTFEGKATTPTSNMVAQLKGYDSNNQQIATASATFSVYVLPDNVVNVDFYHHTKQYGSDALNLPAGVVIDGEPVLLSPVPPGVQFNARYFDGTPTTAGRYPVLAMGYDYTHTDPIIAFKGWYTVEDGPTFDIVADDLRKLENGGAYCPGGSECALWQNESLPKIVRPINNAKDVRYYVEVENSRKLPGSLTFGGDPLNRQKNGYTYNAYDQAKIRIKAVDVDNVAGWSNWFKIGSLGPTVTCQPTEDRSYITLKGVVGQSLNGNQGYEVPTGLNTSVKTFALSSGTLPDGLSLDASTGLFLGTPTKPGVESGLKVTITYPDVIGSTPTICGPYVFSISAAPVSLGYSGLKSDYRVGETLNVIIAAVGAKIDPAVITMNAGAVLPTGVSFDANTGKLTGIVSEAGNFNAGFTLKNGDDRTYLTSLAFEGHNTVTVHDVPATSTIKRYDTSESLFQVSYDAASVIGSETWKLNNGPLPEGFSFDTGKLNVSGGTCLPVNKYGPFNIELTDSTGQSGKTNDFYIDVTEREQLVRNATVSPLTFGVNTNDLGQKPFSVTQQTLAQKCLGLQYTLTPDTLPTGLTFNPATGRISGLPVSKGTTTGYQVKIDEISPYNYSETSDPFDIVINDPPPIKDQALGALQGNVDGSAITSVNPQNVLISIRNSLVGFEQSVVFDGADPIIPGLSFNAVNGTISGKPTAEFNGTVGISYHDAANRVGKLLLPVTIYPYPTLTSTATSYQLPRISDAAQYNIAVTPGNPGFYKGVTYALAPNSEPLPAGLRLSGGSIVGSTTVAKDTSYNIVIRGVSNADSKIYVDYPITLKVVEEVSIELHLKPNAKLVWQIEETTGTVVSRDKFTDTKPTGSAVAPLTYSLPVAPSWMTIDSNGQLDGKPPATPGDVNITVQVKDSEGHIATDTATVRITLSGNIVIRPGGNSTRIKIRQGESLKTSEQTVSNVVAPYTYVLTDKPPTLDFDNTTGVFKGPIESSGVQKWKLDAKDAHDRTTADGYTFQYDVVPPVKIGAPLSAINGKQYDQTKPISVKFQAAENVMGNATYVVTGNVPGHVYYKYYDDNDPTKLATYISHDDGTVVRQGPNDTVGYTEYTYLPADHMIFDTLALTLTGIPSSYGSFGIGLAVADDHESTGYTVNPSDPTRKSYNTAASSTINVVVDRAEDLMVSNTANEEYLYQYTSPPTIQHNVANDAYGRGVVWSKVQGTGDMPNKITQYSPTLTSLGYRGYPDTQGVWSNIQWQATDNAGRKVVTDAVKLTVGPRQALALVASPYNPRGMAVFDQDADLWVRAQNAANGKDIGSSNWSVTGIANLPPGVTYTITDSGVHFTGTSDTIKTYKDIIVSAVDSLGATASINLTFKVVASSDPIVLNVSNITTKVGFPLEMKPPFAAAVLSTDNTYGTVKFTSTGLPNIAGVSINPVTGNLIGTISTVQNFTFNLNATDDTNRLTSKAVVVQVIPNLRLIVPTQVNAVQGATTKQTISTDYAIGAVSYRMGAGMLPTGLSIDPSTGNIIGTVADIVGSYPNLTIIGKDAAGDEQTSNVFAINVTKKTTTPSIANITAKSYTVNVAITNIVPTVTNKSAGDVYSVIGTLPDGLALDSTTGIISGTPTNAGVFPIQIRVRDVNGDGNETTVFNVSVAPATAMSFVTPATSTTIALQTDMESQPQPLSVKDFAGKVTYSITSTNVGATVDNTTATFKIPANATATTKGTAVIKATDQMNRTASVTVTITVTKFQVTLPATGVVSVNAGANYSVTPTVSGAQGTIAFTAANLPPTLNIDGTTGIISGTAPANQGLYSITLTAKDIKTNAVTSIVLSLFVADSGGGSNYRYWRMSVVATNTVNAVYTGGQTWTLIGTANTPTITNVGPGYISNPQLFWGARGYSADITLCATSACNASAKDTTFEWQYDFGDKGANLSNFTLWESGNGMYDSKRLIASQYIYQKSWMTSSNVKMRRSKNGIDWEDVVITGSTGYQECSGAYCYSLSNVRLYY